MNQKILDIAIFTEDVFYTLFPAADESSYEQYLYALADEEAILEFAENRTGFTIDVIRRIVLDEEYLVWLDRNKKNHSEENKSDYSNDLTNEDVERLWVKNNHHLFTVSFSIPFLLYTNQVLPAYHITFSETIQKQLQGILSHTYQIEKEKIIVHNQLMRPDFYLDKFEEKFFEYTNQIFATNTKVDMENIPFLAEQHNENVGMRVLPISILSHAKPILERSEVGEMEIAFHKMMEEEGMRNWCEFIEEELGKKVEVNSYNTLIMPQDLPEFYDEAMQMIEEELNK